MTVNQYRVDSSSHPEAPGSEVLLGLGSNMGDRLSYLSYAVNQLEREVGEMTARSSVWETEPWGFEAEEQFLNMAVEITTPLDPEALLSAIASMELRLGRNRRDDNGYQSRSIDIDILFWGDRVISLPGLTIPHPRIADRRFVLVPLSEIAPDIIHPVSGRSVREMLTLCDDRGEVKLFSRTV